MAAWDFPRTDPQSQSPEPKFLSGPSLLHWEAGKESSSYLISEENSNWEEKRGRKDGHE